MRKLFVCTLLSVALLTSAPSSAHQTREYIKSAAIGVSAALAVNAIYYLWLQLRSDTAPRAETDPSSDDFADAVHLFTSEVQQALQREKSLAADLQRLILAGYSLEKAIQLCTQAAGMKDDGCFTPDVVRAPLTQFRLSALHLASAVGSREAITWLVGKGAALDAQDRRKWTPAHFTALQADPAFLDLFRELGDDFSHLNDAYATANENWALTHHTDPTTQSINLWNDDTQSVETIDGHEFKRLTGATFVESMKISPRLLLKTVWLTPAQEIPESAATAMISFQQARNARKPFSNVYIKRETINGKSVGFGLRALHDIKAGHLIGEYQGEWLGKLPEGSTEYATNFVDAKNFRGYVAFSLDGLPNSYLTGFPDVWGVRLSTAFVAVRDIKAGEPLLWCYGGHPIKWSVYGEFAAAELDKLLSTTTLQAMVKEYDQHDDLHNRVLVNYLANTLPVLLRLCAEGKVKKRDLLALQRLSRADKLNDDNFNLFGPALIAFYDQVEEAKEIRTTVWKFVGNKSRQGNVQVLNLFMNNFALTQERLAIAEDPKRLEMMLEMSWNSMWQLLCNQIPHGSNDQRGDCANLPR